MLIFKFLKVGKLQMQERLYVEELYIKTFKKLGSRVCIELYFTRLWKNPCIFPAMIMIDDT